MILEKGSVGSLVLRQIYFLEEDDFDPDIKENRLWMEELLVVEEIVSTSDKPYCRFQNLATFTASQPEIITPTDGMFIDDLEIRASDPTERMSIVFNTPGDEKLDEYVGKLHHYYQQHYPDSCCENFEGWFVRLSRTKICSSDLSRVHQALGRVTFV